MNKLKNEIQKIISEPQLGAHQLESEYQKLSDVKQQKEFLEALKKLILEGSEKEKTACFTVFEMIGKSNEVETIIRENIDNLSFSESHSLINSLLWLAANISKKWGIDFIKKVIQNFKPKSKEYSYLFNMGIRSIVSTQHWKEAINEIIWALDNFDNVYVIDFFAYFEWKHGESEKNELLNLLKTNNDLVKKINSLKTEIKNRYFNTYSILIQNRKHCIR